MRVEEGFQIIPYAEENPYTSDPVLPFLLKRILPAKTLEEIEPELARFGQDVITKIRAVGDNVAPPRLVQYDQWGKRVDQLHTSAGWKSLKAIAQTEGLPGIFYERKYKEDSRIYGFAKALLMVGDSHEVFCPLSMTDGTARVIELMGTYGQKKHVFRRLISRDPSFAFTSGQWMTEKPGGSDVSRTETTAQFLGKSNVLGPHFYVDGFKFFSSATDSDVAVALARTGSPKDGSRSLSLFLVPLRLPLLRKPSDPVPSPLSNGIFVHRLKNKIGTHALPTAELSLERTEANLIGRLNQGVKNITPVLNITRIWSGLGSVGGLRKCLAIATAYAQVRKVQGGKVLLKDIPIHVAELAKINLMYRGLAHLTFGAIRLMGRVECKVASEEEENRLRIMTPVVKAFAADKACGCMEDAMTALGGAGYMEENDIGRVIRDCLVEKIWEGTVTILALDLLRATDDTKRLGSLIAWATSVIADSSKLRSAVGGQIQNLESRIDLLKVALQNPVPSLMPRPALMLIGYILSGLYLLEHAIWAHTANQPEKEVDVEVFRRWIDDSGFTAAVEDVKKARIASDNVIKSNSAMVFGVKTKL
ncbi:hypothetical protein D9758_002733 [Tetrapyrgos nigripes]|uniref:Acyl-CoA dehydrogenase n=1 Tax=Tetrapyrgos nigripes TaxID=182062 RepID=A0A8H5GR16_9AGAR|nr:hypothetical protein D9758_002733 [Tetrapyrgos nigripes]